MAMREKKRSRTRVVAASVAALFLSVIAVGLIYDYVIPYINRNAEDNRPVLVWEGTITDKKTEIQTDHEVYFLQINATTWESLQGQATLYSKYDIDAYVYYILLPQSGVYVLTTDPAPYLV